PSIPTLENLPHSVPPSPSAHARSFNINFSPRGDAEDSDDEGFTDSVLDFAFGEDIETVVGAGDRGGGDNATLILAPTPTLALSSASSQGTVVPLARARAGEGPNGHRTPGRGDSTVSTSLALAGRQRHDQDRERGRPLVSGQTTTGKEKVTSKTQTS